MWPGWQRPRPPACWSHPTQALHSPTHSLPDAPAPRWAFMETPVMAPRTYLDPLFRGRPADTLILTCPSQLPCSPSAHLDLFSSPRTIAYCAPPQPGTWCLVALRPPHGLPLCPPSWLRLAPLLIHLLTQHASPVALLGRWHSHPALSNKSVPREAYAYRFRASGFCARSSGPQHPFLRPLPSGSALLAPHAPCQDPSLHPRSPASMSPSGPPQQRLT